MYSAVLLTAMTFGGQAPEFHPSCFGCSFPCGGCYSSCHGCRGCYSGCHGCYGGQGCYSGCYGGCHGCHGCYAYAPSVHYGCHFVPAAPHGGCYGCYGYQPSWGVGNSWLGGAGWYTDYGASAIKTPANDEKDKDQDESKDDPKGDEELREEVNAIDTRAKLVVELPANAVLFIDDRPTKSKSKVRTFRTPKLEEGALYYYELRVELERDGKKIVRNKRVTLRAGEEVKAVFVDMVTKADE